MVTASDRINDVRRDYPLSFVHTVRSSCVCPGKGPVVKPFLCLLVVKISRLNVEKKTVAHLIPKLSCLSNGSPKRAHQTHVGIGRCSKL